MLTIRYDVLEVAGGDRLLDLGCGSGRHSFAAQRLGARVVAADLDAAVLKDVRGMAAALDLDEGPFPSVGCAASDATRLPFPDRSFDRVIVSEVLEHVPEVDRAIAEIARVLRPGGTAALSVPRLWPEAVCWALSRQYHSNEGGHVRIFRRGRLIDALRRAGLELYRSHHAHALHAPFWWLKCALGVEVESRAVQAYHRFLVWDIERGHPVVRLTERLANPLIGKSLVVYVRRPGTR